VKHTDTAEQTHYELLQLHPAAPLDLITSAYWRLVGQAQEKRATDSSSEALMHRLTRAYQTLADAAQRAQYDASLGFGELPAAPVVPRRKQGFLSRALQRDSRPQPIDYYEILRVSPEADQALLTEAYAILRGYYLRLVNTGQAVPELMDALYEAYRVTSDPRRRGSYDDQRRRWEEEGRLHAALGNGALPAHVLPLPGPLIGSLQSNGPMEPAPSADYPPPPPEPTLPVAPPPPPAPALRTPVSAEEGAAPAAALAVTSSERTAAAAQPITRAVEEAVERRAESVARTETLYPEPGPSDEARSLLNEMPEHLTVDTTPGSAPAQDTGFVLDSATLEQAPSVEGAPRAEVAAGRDEMPQELPPQAGVRGGVRESHPAGPTGYGEHTSRLENLPSIQKTPGVEAPALLDETRQDPVADTVVADAALVPPPPVEAAGDSPLGVATSEEAPAVSKTPPFEAPQTSLSSPVTVVADAGPSVEPGECSDPDDYEQPLPAEPPPSASRRDSPKEEDPDEAFLNRLSASIRKPVEQGDQNLDAIVSVNGGENGGWMHRLEKFPITIGCASICDIVLPELEARQARVLYRDGRFVVYNLSGSEDSSEERCAVLESGEELKLGPYKLRFRAGAPS
jgi:curved DNA-binding protein CbpA